MGKAAEFDVVVVGAGFAGLFALHRLRCMGLSAKVFEAGDGVGGTWYWNRYPGARVDVESQEYSYSFDEALEREWKWTERYATQPELLRYINHVADRFDLRRDIQLETRVTTAVFDEAAGCWSVTTDKGDAVSARYCIMATGCLSAPKDMDIPGSETFMGDSYRTSRWPHGGVDLTGKRVAVIGTGSSAIQSIPQIAKQASHLTVFQRTPNFSLPAHNAPADLTIFEAWLANREANRQGQRDSGFGSVIIDRDRGEPSALEVSEEERRQAYEDRWRTGGFALIGAYADLIADKAANDTAAEYVREKIRGIVKDPVTAEKLAPKSHPLGTKRPCVDIDYFETYNRPNVSLVDLTETPITTVTEKGVRTTAGETEVDVIVFAIGFDAMTGALCGIDIRGRDGARLKDKWADGPRTYLGLMVAGFPNLFTVTGPGSPSVLSNMIVAIEQHVNWITDCIGWLNDRQVGVIEATQGAQDAWDDHVNEVGAGTLYPLADSWYMGANAGQAARLHALYRRLFGLSR